MSKPEPTTLTEKEALLLKQDLRKFLISRGIWHTVSESWKEGIDLICFEMSIKVKR